MLIVAVAFVTLVTAAFLFAGSGGPGKPGLPGYATRHPLIKEAYEFASESPDQLDEVNCYCGCMLHVHDGRIHSRGLLDCFEKEDGSFERHASECDMCINDALEVRKMAAEGKSKEEIRAAIDRKYAG